jgi:xanthine dehydrogenase accessory factor
MRWFETLAELTQAKIPLVMVTVASVRGHAPREAGAKMLVTADKVYGTIGGGNLEQSAVAKSREILAHGGGFALHRVRLTEKATDGSLAVQCCGGEVELLLEPVVSSRPTLAIFGVGHVGLALAQVLSIFPLELWLIDSRADMLSDERLSPLRPGQAEIKVHHAPILDGIVNDLPTNSHVLIMTHDHAEDLYISEMCLRRSDLGYIGLIGSASKWAHFRHKLSGQGFAEADFSRITTPIGLPQVPGKTPQAIAVAVAAQLVSYLAMAPLSQLQTQESQAL